jgi:hypothetical protein
MEIFKLSLNSEVQTFRLFYAVPYMDAIEAPPQANTVVFH